jgi:regulatory protein
MMRKKLHLKASDVPAGVITAIKHQKNDKLRASVFVGEEFGIGLNVSTIERFRLRKGDELTHSLVEELLRFDNAASAKRIAAKFINSRRRTEKEIRDKLCEFDDDTIEKAITELKDALLIDDKAFAIAYIHDKLLSKPHSSKRLESDLRQKGVTKDVIGEALKESGMTENEEDRALEAAEKKWTQIVRRESDARKQNQKLIAFLASRGFKFDTIKRVVEKISKGEVEESF